MLQDVVSEVQPGSDCRVLLYDPKQDQLPILKGIDPHVDVRTTHPFDSRGVAWDMQRDIREPRVAIEIAFTLIPEKHESQPFFSDAARHLLYGVMISYLRRGVEWQFADLLRAVSTESRLRNVLAACDQTRDVLSSYFGDQRVLQNVLSTLATKLLQFGPLAACWESAREKVALEDWINEEWILILGNAETSRHAIDAINRCLFKRAVDLTLNQSESNTRRTWFILDELSEAGKLDGIVPLCKKGRSKGACVVLAFQSIAGLRDTNLYGPQMTAEILGQIGHRIIGRLECPETAKWASDLFGDQEIRQVTKNRTYGKEPSTSYNEQFITRPAVLPAEFMSVTPCNIDNGLTGYYLSRLGGAFEATIDGEELFQEDLIPADPTVAHFTPRPVETQYLNPWTPQQEALFAPTAKNPEIETQDKPSRTHDLLRDLEDL